MMMLPLRLTAGAALLAFTAAHGQMNYPPSTRQGLPGK
eukprot:COSAG02_NODE_52781_length_305_cov_5.898058_1_plen_37_part_10